MKYSQLSHDERNAIYILQCEWYTKKQIATKLNRHPSTIAREIKRNSSLISKKFNHLPEEEKTKDKYHYLPDTAQNKRNKRRKQANWRPPLKTTYTYHFVIEKLKAGWSPDIIAWTIKREYPYYKKFHISHECIYQFIYKKENENLHLKQFLVRKHKTRRKYSGRKTQKTPKIPNRRNIIERNQLYKKLENRKEFWHFEGDSILSQRTTYSAIHTEVERKTRFIFATKIQRKTAEYTTQATISIFQKFPKGTIKTTTWDNWTEFSNHEQLTRITGIPVFFADPYKSWQRWTNEHANGMIRRFFPKGTNFDEITEEQIQEVVNYLNNRPRKILGYRTAKECFDEELEKLQNQE